MCTHCPIKDGERPELDANALAGNIGDFRSRLYPENIKWARVPNSRLTLFPVISGILDPDFIKKLIKGDMVPGSRLTRLSVLAGILDPDFTEKPINDTLGPTSTLTRPMVLGGPRSRLYRKTNKWDTGTDIEANALACTSENSRPRLYQKIDKGGTVAAL